MGRAEGAGRSGALRLDQASCAGIGATRIRPDAPWGEKDSRGQGEGPAAAPGSGRAGGAGPLRAEKRRGSVGAAVPEVRAAPSRGTRGPQGAPGAARSAGSRAEPDPDPTGRSALWSWPGEGSGCPRGPGPALPGPGPGFQWCCGRRWRGSGRDLNYNVTESSRTFIGPWYLDGALSCGCKCFLGRFAPAVAVLSHTLTDRLWPCLPLVPLCWVCWYKPCK